MTASSFPSSGVTRRVAFRALSPSEEEAAVIASSQSGYTEVVLPWKENVNSPISTAVTLALGVGADCPPATAPRRW